MADHDYAFETLALHAGQIPDAGDRRACRPAVPDHVLRVRFGRARREPFNLQTFGNVYTRLSNPTTAVFESGRRTRGGARRSPPPPAWPAQMTAILAIPKRVTRSCRPPTLYGGTGQFAVGFERMGIRTHFVDADDPENFRRAITKNTKALYAETLSAIPINVLDIAAVAGWCTTMACR